MSLRVDLHCHTSRSYDAYTSPRDVVRRAREAGLDRVCITDHGTMRGAFEAKTLDPALVILGEEIRCEGGTELIGLWMEQEIPDGLSVERTGALIREQGGLVYVPHPFAYLRSAEWHARRAIAVADIVEIFNPRAFYRQWNRRAAHAATSEGLPAAASSDAHFPWEIGQVFTEVPAFTTSAGMLAALASGKTVTGREGTGVCHVLSISLGLTRRVRGRR